MSLKFKHSPHIKRLIWRKHRKRRGDKISSTNRGAIRHIDDKYSTPPELAKLICQRIKNDICQNPKRILEPGCGEGYFLDAFKDVWPETEAVGIEINPEFAKMASDKGHSVIIDDVLLCDEKRITGFDLVISNPPFKYADSFIKRLLDVLPEGGNLSFLLRLNFLGGQERYEKLWKTSPLYRIYIMPARPGFTKNSKTDSIEYMIAVFRKGYSGSPTLEFLDNRFIKSKHGR